MHLPAFTKLAAALLLALPLGLHAQAPATAPSPRASASPSPRASVKRIPPYRGTITSADSAAQTFTIVGKTTTRVFKLTPQTKLTRRAGGTATFADLKAGEYVTGVAKKLGAGQYEAESVKVGPKPAAAPASASPSPRANRGGSRGGRAGGTPAASPTPTAGPR